MGVTQSNVSRHLAKLRNIDLVESERKEQWVYYNLNNKIFKEFPFLQQLLENEIEKLEICEKDKERLLDYNKSNLSCENLTESDFFDKKNN